MCITSHSYYSLIEKLKGAIKIIFFYQKGKLKCFTPPQPLHQCCISCWDIFGILPYANFWIKLGQNSCYFLNINICTLSTYFHNQVCWWHHLRPSHKNQFVKMITWHHIPFTFTGCWYNKCNVKNKNGKNVN